MARSEGMTAREEQRRFRLEGARLRLYQRLSDAKAGRVSETPGARLDGPENVRMVVALIDRCESALRQKNSRAATAPRTMEDDRA